MPRLIVSYEIAWEDAQTYDRIRQDLEEAVKQGLRPQQFWAETTSFYIIATPEPAIRFIQRVVIQAGLREDRDKLVVLSKGAAPGFAWGAIENPQSLLILGAAKKL